MCFFLTQNYVEKYLSISRILDDLPKKKPPQLYKPSNPDTLAYLDFSVSTTGMLAGVKVLLSPHTATVCVPLCVYSLRGISQLS